MDYLLLLRDSSLSRGGLGLIGLVSHHTQDTFGPVSVDELMSWSEAHYLYKGFIQAMLVSDKIQVLLFIVYYVRNILEFQVH